MSVYENLQTALAGAAGALALTIGGEAVTVARRKLPVQRGTLDRLPALLVVVGDGPETSEPFGTDGTQLVGYLVQMVLVAATARQPREGLPDLLDGRESLRKLVQRPGAIGAVVPELLRLDCLPQAPIGRASWLKLYDTSSLAVRYFCVEAAT